MDAAGLKRRITFGIKVTMIQDITPRTMRFLNFWEEKAQDILHLRGKKQEKAKNELSVLDDVMQSRYDMIHARGGLLDILVKEFNAMAEIHLTLEYGDYLSLACRKLKDKSMDEMQWRVDKVDWEDAAQKIREEEIALEEEQRHRPIRTPTPYLDSQNPWSGSKGREVSDCGLRREEQHLSFPLGDYDPQRVFSSPRRQNRGG